VDLTTDAFRSTPPFERARSRAELHAHPAAHRAEFGLTA